MNIGLNGAKTMKDLLSKEEFFLPKPGSILSGEVINVSKGSAIIDLGSAGIGIVYPGEFYDNPDRMKALKSGEKVSAMLIELENEEGYRELSLKAAQITTAWQDIKDKKESGEIITTQIININKGGLIVEVGGIQGFLPLSQLSGEHYPKVEGGDTTKIVQALQKFKGQDEYKRRQEELLKKYPIGSDNLELEITGPFSAPLPDTSIWEGDVVRLRSGAKQPQRAKAGKVLGHENAFLVSWVSYRIPDDVVDSRDQKPRFSLSNCYKQGSEDGWPEEDLELVARGQFWHEAHGETFKFPTQEEEASFLVEAGRVEIVTREIRGNSFIDAVLMINEGLGHGMIRQNSFYGWGSDTYFVVVKFADESFGRWIRHMTLSTGFVIPCHENV